MGLTKIWITKDKLVDMIMGAQQSNHERVEEEESGDSLKQILVEIQDLKEKVAKKDAEIEELNKMVQSAYVTINRLNDRVSTLEEQVSSGQHNPASADSGMPESPLRQHEKTLLLGDTNLSDVKASDLATNCSIRTIQGATMDLVRCWINEKLDWTPARCILYCGIHELMEDVSADNILDGLGSLILDLKKKNETMEIFVCELIPTLGLDDLDDRISQYNTKLKEWSSNNGIKIISTYLNFRFGTGDEMMKFVLKWKMMMKVYF